MHLQAASQEIVVLLELSEYLCGLGLWQLYEQWLWSLNIIGRNKKCLLAIGRYFDNVVFVLAKLLTLFEKDDPVLLKTVSLPNDAGGWGIICLNLVWFHRVEAAWWS